MFNKLKSVNKKSGEEKNITTKMNHTNHLTPIKDGYFLAQALMTSGPENPFKERFYSVCMTSVKEAKPYIDKAAEFVDGLELQLMTQSIDDIKSAVDICNYARDKGIDIWLCPRPYKYVFTLPVIPKRLAAFTMNSEGYIVPAYYAHHPWYYLPDPMNPDASDFLVEEGYDIFYRHFEKVINGYMWPETILDIQGGNIVDMGPVKDHPRHYVYYWRQPVYSDVSLELWRKWCRENSIFYKGRPVNQFPVHNPDMVKNGRGKTAYFPGYTLAVNDIWSQPVRDLPRPEGIWAHWYKFLCTTYTRDFLIRLSKHWHRIYAQQNSEWKGVLYFGSSLYMLSYEDFVDQNGFLPPKTGRSMGHQTGIDLKALASQPDINYILHEQPPSDSCYIIEQFNHLIPEAKRGLMLHGGINGHSTETDPKEDERRWQIIKQYRPKIIAMFPLWNILQEKVIFRPGIGMSFMEFSCRPGTLDVFKKNLREYQDSW